MGIEDWFSYRGIDYAIRESATTQARHGAARVFADERTGNSIRMPAHFRLRDSGFQLRVHAHWDDREKTWLVGHVGEHLTTASDPHWQQPRSYRNTYPPHVNPLPPTARPAFGRFGG